MTPTSSPPLHPNFFHPFSRINLRHLKMAQEAFAMCPCLSSPLSFLALIVSYSIVFHSDWTTQSPMQALCCCSALFSAACKCNSLYSEQPFIPFPTPSLLLVLLAWITLVLLASASILIPSESLLSPVSWVRAHMLGWLTTGVYS